MHEATLAPETQGSGASAGSRGARTRSCTGVAASAAGGALEVLGAQQRVRNRVAALVVWQAGGGGDGGMGGDGELGAIGGGDGEGISGR